MYVSGGPYGIMVIIITNGYSDPSSNHGQGCLYFYIGKA